MNSHAQALWLIADYVYNVIGVPNDSNLMPVQLRTIKQSDELQRILTNAYEQMTANYGSVHYKTMITSCVYWNLYYLTQSFIMTPVISSMDLGLTYTHRSITFDAANYSTHLRALIKLASNPASDW